MSSPMGSEGRNPTPARGAPHLRESASRCKAAAAAQPEDGLLLLETAVWFERVGEPDKALGYARRAEALRANLRRRKAATRKAKAPPAESDPEKK